MTSRHHLSIADDLESGLPSPVPVNTTRRRVDAHSISPWQSNRSFTRAPYQQEQLEDDEPLDRLHPSKGVVGRIRFQLRQVSIKRVLIFIFLIIGLIALITHNRHRPSISPHPFANMLETGRLQADRDPTLQGGENIDLNSTIAKAFLSKEHQKWGFHNPIYRVPPTVPPPLTSPSPLKHVPLTIFTTIRDLTAAYQRDNPSDYLKSWNALRSWQLLGKSTGGSSPDIMLFVDHGDETCHHLREEKKIDMKGISCITIPCFAKEYKKPFMHCIWNYAMEHARTDYLTFLNGDIVLLDEFYGSFQATVAQIPHFMMVSQRTDVEPMDWPKEKLKYFIHVLSNEDQSASSNSLDLPINGEAEMPNASPDSAFMYEYPYDDTEWMGAFRKHVATKGVRHPDSGIDMFTFHRKVMQLVEFPPFLVGVYRWDNWVLAELLARSASAPFDATHGLRYVHPLSNRTSSGIFTSSSQKQEEEPLHFLVVDATNSLYLIHDNLRSDHLHDLGAVYNDDLVKRRSGLRYKMGRIGNADVVLQPPVSQLTTAEKAPASTIGGCNPSRSNECYLQWNTHTDNDRLDVHLIRHASQKGTIGFVQISKKYLALLSNFLCWATQRSQVSNLIFVAEDVKSYQTMQQWGLHFPVLLFPNATDLPKQQPAHHSAPVANADLGVSTTPMEEPSSDPDVPAGAPLSGGGRTISARLSPKQAFTNFALLMGWRQSVMSRILDLGFSLLLLDLDTLFFEQPLGMLSTMQRLYATREWTTNQAQYHSQVKSGYPMNVASCTVLATTRQVLITASTATSPAIYEEIYSTNFMSLLPNKYSRFFLKKLQDCTTNIMNKHQNIVGTHRKKEPCSYIEDRCAHDILKNMHSELSVNDFLTCALPKEFWNDQTRFRITDAPPTNARDATIAGSAAATAADVSAPPTSNHVVWPWSNDPSTSWDILRLSTLTRSREKHLQSAFSALPLLPRSHETLGFSTVSQSSWTFPKMLHDSSLGGVDALQTKINKWKKAGLWCNFQPYRVNMQRALIAPAPAPAAPSTIGNSQQLLFLKIHVHLQPRKDFTPAAFRAFLLAMSGASYAPQDSIDIEFDIAQFYTPLQLKRDEIRKQVKALRSKNGGVAIPDEEEALIRKIMDPKNPTTGVADSSILPDLSLSTVTDDLSTEMSEWPLTLSEILEMFKEWKWAHGMKHVLKKHISIVNPSYIDPLLDPKEQAQALKLINEKVARDKKAQLLKQQQKTATPTAAEVEDEHSHDTFRIRYAGEEWLIPYSFHEQAGHDGTSGSTSSTTPTATSTASQIDTPILLLNPSLIVHPQWYEFIRKQLVAYPKRHGEPSGVDRRWLGMSILPLISTASVLENTPDARSTSGAEIPYPSSHALLAPVIRDQYPEVPSTQLLRLIGQEWIHSEERRVREENESTGGDSTISGRKESGGYRTQLVNPLGLILFSSSIHHFNNWRKLQYNVRTATDSQANTAAAAATQPSNVGLFPPCWSRLDPVTQVLPQNPHMVALLRFIFETGSFITAPASQSLSSSPLGIVTRKPQDSENSALPKMKSVDMKNVFLPTSLASLPLFDLSGASVPLPDTLAYRALVVKAASGAGDNDDPHAGCTWPAIHPKLLQAFHVDLSQSNV